MKQITQFSDEISAVAFGDDALYMLSRQHAPHGKILRLPLATPDFKNAKTIIPETPRVIQSFVPTSNLLYVTQLVGGPSEIHIFDHSGIELGTVPAEPVSVITQIVSLENEHNFFPDQSDCGPQRWVFFLFRSGHEEKYDYSAKEKLPVSFADVETVREFGVSKDGSRIPVNIIRERNQVGWTKPDYSHRVRRL